MDKQNVILKTQAEMQDYEVIGQGGMVYSPCQVGEWWVMPADQYTGTIPPDIMRKWENFKALNVPVRGYLIADDMREVLVKREIEAQKAREIERKAEEERQRKLIEQERQLAITRQNESWERETKRRQDLERQRENEETLKKVLVAAGVVAGIGVIGVAGVAVLGVGAVLAALRFDPILIAVMPDGRWVCLGAWWD